MTDQDKTRMRGVTYLRSGRFWCRPLSRFVARTKGQTLLFQGERTASLYAQTMNEWNKETICKVVAV